ncbi:MAG: TIGR03905 family TSCPD domain-containing protein [Eubacteriaceae bacterium]|nr:TIGR03905 family TSCPD domain-containing protein [Eubacteriaceae bacterium]
MHYDYKTSGTCSMAISFDVEGDVIRNVSFLGGCPGNTKAVERLVDGLKAEEIISKLEGIPCGGKKTSCGDQLARAIKEAINM